MAPGGQEEVSEMKRHKNPFSGIPDHILADSILSSYTLNDYYTYSQVCKQWSSALHSDWLWKRHCEERGFQPTDLACSNSTKSKKLANNDNYRKSSVWRDIYRKRHSVEKRFSKGQYVDRKRDSRSAPIMDVKTSLLPTPIALAACRTGRLLVYELGGGDGERCTRVTEPKMELIKRIKSGHSNAASAALSCETVANRFAVAGYADGSLSMWNLESNEAVVGTMCHPGGATTSAREMEGSKLLSAGSDGYCRLWDPLESVKCIWTSPPPAREGEDPSMRIRRQFTSVSAVDGGPLVIAGKKDSSWRAFDTRVGGVGSEVVKTKMTDWCMCVESDSRQSWMIRASDKSVKLFDMRRITLHGDSGVVNEAHRSSRLLTRFCSDGRYRLVSCGLDGRVLVSSLENNDNAYKEVHSEDDYMLACAFDSTRLVVAGLRGKVDIFSFDG